MDPVDKVTNDMIQKNQEEMLKNALQQAFLDSLTVEEIEMIEKVNGLWSNFLKKQGLVGND